MRIYYFTVCFLLASLVIMASCNSQGGQGTRSRETVDDEKEFADILEESLQRFIIDPWYPRNIDSISGGFSSGFTNDWSPAAPPLEKSLVQQSRHVWATSFIYENYPEKREFLEYAAHGFRFLRDHLWDKTSGGFFYECNDDGTRDGKNVQSKSTYGQAFAVYGLSRYYSNSKDPGALELAKKAFQWMEDHPYDPEYGGYFDILHGDGAPQIPANPEIPEPGEPPAIGLKDYNSSIHILEAFTSLHQVWPDSLVRERLKEIFLLVRDTFVHPDGYLQLYFYPDWTRVPDAILEARSGNNYWFSQHFSYCHDVETAFLLLEAAHELGLHDDPETHRVAKRLVDHSLESGWDMDSGGFYYAGKQSEGEVTVFNKQKSWWGAIEGLNALVLMHTLYPGDHRDYYGKALQQWKYIDENLIDKVNGGWYNSGIDRNPESVAQLKSHPWKTTYHNVRGMVNCTKMFREKAGK